jgi:hypothetical protein
MAMETVSEALARLAGAGYEEEFQAVPGGLRGDASGIHSPEEFHVDEIVRFEGESDPSEEAAIFALRLPDSKGTYTVAFGTLIDERDAEMVRRLSVRRA